MVKKVKQTASQRMNKLPSSVKVETEAAKRVAFPGAYSRAAENRYIKNLINAGSSKPYALPDPKNPYTHVVHHRLALDIVAPADDTPFAVVAVPDPRAALSTFVGNQPNTPLKQWTASFESGVTSAYLPVPDASSVSSFFNKNTTGVLNKAPARYNDAGGVPLDTSLHPIVSVPTAEGWQHVYSSGDQTLGTDAAGWLDFGTTPSQIDCHVQYSMLNPDGVSQHTWVVETSPDKNIVTSFANGVVVEAFSIGHNINIAAGLPTGRYWRLTLKVNNPGTLAQARIINSLTTQVTPYNANSAGLSAIVTQSYPTLVVGTKAWRPVACNVLVSNTSSDITCNGTIAGVQLASNYSTPGTVPNYAEIAKLLNAYSGPLKKGTFGFWLPDSNSQSEFLAWSDEEANLPLLVVAGVFGSAGGSVKVVVDCIIEYLTENEAFGPTPSRSAPLEIAAAAEVFGNIPIHFCENPLHPVVQKVIDKAASVYMSTMPYVEKGMAITKALAPIAAMLV